MIESKLYHLLDTFSSKELDYISQRITHSHAQSYAHLQLWNHLQLILTSKITDKSKETAFANVFPDQKFNDQKLRLCVSQLYKKIEHILFEKEIGNREILKAITLLEIYKSNSLPKHYQSQLKKVQSLIDNAVIQDVDFLDKKIIVESEKYEVLISQKRNQDLNIQNILDQTDISYYAKKLKYICTAMAHQAVYKIDYKLGNIEEILAAIADLNVEDHPALAIYHSCYQMLCSPDDLERFSFFRSQLRKFQQYFKREELRTIYLLGINVCIKKLNKGDKDFGRIGLDMYQEALDNRSLLINNKITRYTYRNVAMMAIRVGDFKWAADFTETNRDHLSKSDKKAAYHFNRALINYNQKKLDAALENIIEADFKDHLINLAAKTLQAKIYYELDEDNLLYSHLDSMDMYIIRNKVLGYHRENYRNIISYLKKLLKHNPYDKEKTQKLKDKISEVKTLTEKSWFMTQLE